MNKLNTKRQTFPGGSSYERHVEYHLCEVLSYGVREENELGIVNLFRL